LEVGFFRNPNPPGDPGIEKERGEPPNNQKEPKFGLWGEKVRIGPTRVNMGGRSAGGRKKFPGAKEKFPLT